MQANEDSLAFYIWSEQILPCTYILLRVKTGRISWEKWMRRRRRHVQKIRSSSVLNHHARQHRTLGEWVRIKKNDAGLRILTLHLQSCADAYQMSLRIRSCRKSERCVWLQVTLAIFRKYSNPKRHIEKQHHRPCRGVKEWQISTQPDVTRPLLLQ